MRSKELTDLINKEQLDDLYYIAKENNVACDFIEIKNNPSTVDDGIYFVITPDLEMIQVISTDIHFFLDIIEKKKLVCPGTFIPHCMYIKYNPCNERFFKYDCIYNTKTLGLIKMAYHENHTLIPNLLSSIDVNEIVKWNRIRNDTFYVGNARSVANEILHDICTAKSKNPYFLEENNIYSFFHQLFGSQKVNYKYFEKNKIALEYYTVDSKFFKFFKKELKKYHSARYYKTPYKFTAKNLSKEFESTPEFNIYEEDTGYTKYCFGFPLKHRDIFRKIDAKYRYQNYDIPKTFEELQSKYSSPNITFSYMKIYSSLVKDFYIRCCSNKVPFMIDTEGVMAKLDDDNAIIVYNAADQRRIDETLKQVLNWKMQESYINANDMQKSKENAPDYKNPLLPDKTKKARKK